jgi:hypothetical protein
MALASRDGTYEGFRTREQADAAGHTMALGTHRRLLRMRVSGVPGTVSTSG